MTGHNVPKILDSPLPLYNGSHQIPNDPHNRTNGPVNGRRQIRNMHAGAELAVAKTKEDEEQNRKENGHNLCFPKALPTK